jgi:hypothetical protein
MLPRHRTPSLLDGIDRRNQDYREDTTVLLPDAPSGLEVPPVATMPPPPTIPPAPLQTARCHSNPRRHRSHTQRRSRIGRTVGALAGPSETRIRLGTAVPTSEILKSISSTPVLCVQRTPASRCRSRACLDLRSPSLLLASRRKLRSCLGCRRHVLLYGLLSPFPLLAMGDCASPQAPMAGAAQMQQMSALML